MTTCCNNPRIVSSAFADVCESCGWYQSYRGDCEEGYNFSTVYHGNAHGDISEDEDE